MQISSTPTAYGGGRAERLLNMLLQPQAPPAGQDLPGGATTAAASAPTPPSGGPSATRFVSHTLASLLSAQEAPPTSADIAGKIIGVADTNGDGALSLNEVETALGSDTTSGADGLGQAFSAIDTNGDGQISADELTTALDAQTAVQGTQGAHHGHHGRHAHPAPPSSSDLASQAINAADTDGDGQLSLTEIEKALGDAAATGANDVLSAAVGKLDSNGDGLLSASELSNGIDAFRAAHHRGGDQTASQASTGQAVTA
jgi:Ca2+-binding EF-hand superfamily protein